MIQILIVEDELIIAEDVKNSLIKKGFDVLGIAMDYDEAISILKLNKPDLILLDVNLNSVKDGIDLANTINEYYVIPFIFTTSYSDSSTLERAKKTNPINYLVKPFKEEQLIAAIEIALHKLAQIENSETNFNTKASDAFIIKNALFIKEKFSYTKLILKDILWIKSDGNYLEIKTNTKDELVRASLSNFIEKLTHEFFRTHKSYIVNLNYITKIETNNVYINNVKIPLSKSYYDDLINKLNII